ncbi:DEAD/DEAH box helicase family protein [Glacieibacterium frigidum]|uniref:Restriction endonuclease subunit R n=1 Tax=Glacieibacterium frigidum TaxID=2593303 RepID=A0A552UA87_9SPHN|nr:DEAD/DEAH box helicase family protein [Glacieibacterium frigidum]TRW15136.1 restriction endonuclease subunit R [Glacieibacterium frigidum]
MTTSINFEFLRERWPGLAALGGFAEAYAASDPASALMKLRRFGEEATAYIYRAHRLPRLPQSNQNDLLTSAAFETVAPPVVRNKLHTLRIVGNRAVHGGAVNAEQAVQCCREAFDVGRLFAVTYAGVLPSALPEFDANALSQRSEPETAKLRARASAAEAALADALDRLSRAAVPPPSGVAVALPDAAQALGFNEARTRSELITALLTEAGWSGSTVHAERPVGHQPTPSGKGSIDYALLDDDGTVLAVFEVKRTGTDPERGREQALHYAKGVAHEQPWQPLVLFGNGFDLWRWDEARGEPPRRIFGLPAKSSLQRLRHQPRPLPRLADHAPDARITGRDYQREAIARVAARFDAGHRKALIVMATGTGKTRVAVSLSDVLLRAGWAKRILFLCDRRELRKQARDAFAEHLPGEPIRVIDRRMPADPPERIFFATYPGMMGVYRALDSGFFDLIIADESHRSLYNIYRELFLWFDSRQLGLTATPVDMVSRNTFAMFGCEDGAPTFNYGLAEAIAYPWLAPFEVFDHSTTFLRDGLKLEVLTPAQLKALEDEGKDPAELDFDAAEIDRAVFNKDTNRQILRNLMEHGIRDADGALPGKTIVFARSHAHAVLLVRLFDELYPQYGGRVARVIDSHDPRADTLLDNFKVPTSDLRIAVSVDMLDTGIDVPEIVNLVFARPVRSPVKFWQMVGRGTRLCADLFGPGADKTVFRIFDHWGNFEHFGKSLAVAPRETPSEALLTRVFRARIQLGLAGQEAGEADTAALAATLMAQDLAALDERSAAVRDKWQAKRQAQDPTLLARLAPADVALLGDIAPLFTWGLLDDGAAARFDLLIANLQTARLRGTAAGSRFAEAVMEAATRLPMTLTQVAAQAPLIRRIATPSFWASATTADLETVRLQLRPLMRLSPEPLPGPGPALHDIVEDAAGIRTARRAATFPANDMAAYRHQVEAALKKLFVTDPVLRRIRAGEAVSTSDLDHLAALALVQNPSADLATLREFYPEAPAFAAAIRAIVGADRDAVHATFAAFTAPRALTGPQLQFLRLLESEIVRAGVLAPARLYEPPFTGIEASGPDALFGPHIDALFDLVARFAPPLKDA